MSWDRDHLPLKRRSGGQVDGHRAKHHSAYRDAAKGPWYRPEWICSVARDSRQKQEKHWKGYVEVLLDRQRPSVCPDAETVILHENDFANTVAQSQRKFQPHFDNDG